MIELRLAANIVKLVIKDGKKYLEAVNEVFPNERTLFQSSNVSVNVARVALKRYFLFENILQEIKLELSIDKKCLLYVVLANMFYAKSITNNACITLIKSEFSEEEFLKIEPILRRKEPLEDLITFEKDSDFYIATKYNCPIWLVHMWRKHFGDQITIDFLNSSIKRSLQTYVINTLKTDGEALKKKYPELSSPFDDVVIYEGTKRFEVTPEYLNGDMIYAKLGFKTLIDTLYNPFHEVLIYSGYDDDFVETAIIKADRKNGLNIAVPNLDSRGKLMRFIRLNDVHNVNLFEVKDEYSLKAGVSYKQDMVVVFPKSSRFDIVSKYPDFLLHFDRDELDGLIEDEKEKLELFAPYVSDGGELVYIVNTLNKKESTNIIVEFLEKHPEFSLIKEEQVIASQPFATTMYYALMIRSEVDD